MGCLSKNLVLFRGADVSIALHTRSCKLTFWSKVYEFESRSQNDGYWCSSQILLS